jgi:hypothetical protein
MGSAETQAVAEDGSTKKLGVMGFVLEGRNFKL